MAAMSDRRVHATHPRHGDVVRHDATGRWFVEHPRRRRRQIAMRDAAALAAQWSLEGGEVFLGVPGGRSFDAAVRADPNGFKA